PSMSCTISSYFLLFFFFNDSALTKIYTLSLHDALPISDEAVPSFVSGAMAKAGKGLLEGTLQAGTSAVSDKLLDLVGLGGKSAADKGKDTRDYLAAAFPELNALERAGADRSEERFSRNAETDLVCRLLLEKKKTRNTMR